MKYLYFARTKRCPFYSTNNNPLRTFYCGHKSKSHTTIIIWITVCPNCKFCSILTKLPLTENTPTIVRIRMRSRIAVCPLLLKITTIFRHYWANDDNTIHTYSEAFMFPGKCKKGSFLNPVGSHSTECGECMLLTLTTKTKQKTRIESVARVICLFVGIFKGSL